MDLVLFLKSSINLTVEDSSKYYIDVCIDKNTMQEWRFTGFYGEAETARRIEAWDSLRSLNHHPNTPWLCAGDFNELVIQDEKLGGTIQSSNPMQLLRDVIDECGFVDLRFVDPKFTWSRHFKMDVQSGKDLTEVWRIMLGSKNYLGHMSTTSVVIHRIMFLYS